MIQKLLFVFILLLTDLVFSQSKKTEFFWQPGSSQSDFSIIGQYTSNIIEYTTGSLKVKQETISTNFGIAYNYGLSEIMAIGIEVNSPSITQKIKLNGTSFSETKLSGLGDIEFNFKSHLPLAGGNFVFQTYVSFSPGDQEIKTDSGGNSTVNGYSGGHTITPVLGYELPLGTSFLIFAVSYDAYKGDKTSKSTAASGAVTTTTTSGEEKTSLAIAFEMPSESGLGIGLAYVRTTKADETTKETGATTKGYTLSEVKAYFPITLGPGFKLIPELVYAQYEGKVSDIELDSQSIYAAKITARFTF